LSLEAIENNTMPSLKIFDIFYGTKCQITCQQCDTRSDLMRKGEYDPDIETIKEGIVLAKQKFDIEIYSLLGGEPLLYKDKIISILEIIRSIDKTALIWLPTNGDLINKNIEFLTELILKYEVLLVVSDHFSNFKDKTRSNKIKNAVDVLVKNVGIQKVHSDILWTEIMYRRPGESGWEEYWVDVKPYKGNSYCAKENKLDSPTNDDLWWNGRCGIYPHPQDSHLKHYYMKGNKPKPFNSVDINRSYFSNCPSNFCTFLYDKKLYKCAALGTLKKFLERHDAINDPEWQKFLEYKPLDFTNCTDEEVTNFSISKFKPISECAMCPSSNEEVILTEENVLPIKFYKK
jgi:organic radical activating enzyme